MLFSSGGSPQNASSILSGEGFDEAQPGESPFVVSAVLGHIKGKQNQYLLVRCQTPLDHRR
jgi:hypothetical protein